jgi:hypothetical protein
MERVGSSTARNRVNATAATMDHIQLQNGLLRAPSNMIFIKLNLKITRKLFIKKAKYVLEARGLLHLPQPWISVLIL